MRNRIIIVIVLSIFLIGCQSQQREKNNSIITRSGEEVLSAYMNGENVTEEYKEREQRAKDTIATFLNRESSEIEFHTYCMLEMDGMTIEAPIDGIEYTFTLNIEGELLGIGRSDGKKIERK